MTITESAGPIIDETHVTFRLEDPEEIFDAVALYQEIMRPNDGPSLERDQSTKTWSTTIARPPVGRMEYQFIVSGNGGIDMILDPANPLTAPGAFGDKSLIEFPGYEAPSWVSAEVPTGTTETVSIKSKALRTSLQMLLWTAPDHEADEPLPLLVANDGIDYANFSQLTLFLDAMTHDGTLPPMRAALLQPVRRDETFSASSAYARAIAHEVVPELDRLAPVPRGRNTRVGMGASLGALAMLHAHRRHPPAFGGLYLQSGSYFRARHERYESFSRYSWISRFVSQIHSATEWPYPVRVTITCGKVEENLPNNEAMADALERQGYDVRFVANPDAHNWVGWRDTFDPHLVDLLRDLWIEER